MAGDELVPRPARGRVFTGSVRVRLADLSRTGRLRLDAIARFAQDVASDDAADAGQRPDRAWVVRRLVLELHDDRAARLRDDLTLDTWCSGVGPRWAERRTDVRLGPTVVARAAAVWVLIDVATGRPVPLGADFDRAFAPAAGGRRVGQRLRHAGPGRDAGRAHWPLRVTDFDLLGHVNNTAYWAAAEDTLAALWASAPSAVARAGPRSSSAAASIPASPSNCCNAPPRTTFGSGSRSPARCERRSCSTSRPAPPRRAASRMRGWPRT